MSHWDRQAALGGLRAVIDPNDTTSYKNTWIDVLTKTALSSRARFSRRHQVLDFGCGIGRITLWLAPRVKAVVGVDSSASMLEQARAAADKAAGTGNASFLHFDGTRLPTDRPFDHVTCVYVLECISSDADFSNALSEMARVTRTGGRLLFIERTSDHSPNEPWSPPSTIRRRPLAEYHAAFQAAGLRLLDQVPVRDPGPVCYSPTLNRALLSGALPAWTLPWVARVDMALKTRRPRPFEWVDYLFVCEKAQRQPQAGGAHEG
jgi:ubiquinone/menaquinone biosynthesis C-methylase UbiE